MSTTTPTSTRARMNSSRKLALTGGAFYVITFLASIPALLFLGPVLNNPDYIVSSGSDTQVIIGCLLDLVTALAGIGSAVALFSVVKRQNEGFALGFVTSRIVEAVFIVIGVVSLLSVVALRQTGATGSEATSLVTVGHALVTARNWTFLLGPDLMAGVNALLLGTLLYRSRLVPRILPTIGLIGAPLLLTSTVCTILGVNSQGSIWSSIAVAPIFVWELSLGIYLVVKGFKPSPLTNEVLAAPSTVASEAHV